MRGNLKGCKPDNFGCNHADMTLGHLVLAIGFPASIVVGMLFEEHDLIAAFGDSYRAYCRGLPRYVPDQTLRRD